MNSRLARSLLGAAVIAGAALHPTHPAQAQWGVEGVQVSDAGSQYVPRTIPDGSGGVIVTWRDTRSGDYDIYAQRLNASGAPQWTPDGVLVCGALGSQTDPVICTDGSGGAIIAWPDLRGGVLDIYVQRITSAGAAQWTANGVAICVAAGQQDDPVIVQDSFGGAIMAWEDTRGASTDIYTQRVNSIGVVQWAANGVALCLAAGSQIDVAITTNGSSTATVAWRDFRGANSDIYARRVNPAGVPQWAVNGVAVCLAADHQDGPQVMTDGSTGVIVAWRDWRNGSANLDLYAQRLNSLGTAQWAADGLPVCDAAGSQEQMQAVADGSGGAIAVWNDYRGGSSALFAQRVDGAGAEQWAADGVAVSSGLGDQFTDAIGLSGAGGAVVLFGVSNASFDVYAQRLDGAGAKQWGPEGVPLAFQSDTQSPQSLTADGGGAFVAWEDRRNSTSVVALQRVLANGNPADLDLGIGAVSDVPADQGGWVRLTVPHAAADAGLGQVTGYNVWRQIPGMLAGKSAAPAARGDRSAIAAQAVALIHASRFEPVHLSPNQAAAANFPPGSWESMGFHAARQLSSYDFLAATRNDSPSAGPADETFVVTAHTAYPAVFSVSPAAVGYSTDNLAPGMPQNLGGEATAPNTIHLSWDPNAENDLWHYAVYRGSSPDFVPDPGNRIGTPVSPSWDDGSFDISDYYKVSAVDRHGNESAFAPLAPNQVADTPGAGAPMSSYLGLVAPNPFVSRTVIRFGQVQGGGVSVGIFDPSGRRVRALLSAHRPAGEHRLEWDGRDDYGARVRPGVYWVRLAGPGFAGSRRIVRAE